MADKVKDNKVNPVHAPVAPVTPTAPVAVEAKPPSEAELMAQMNAAVKSGDYKAVAKVAQELVKFQKSKEAAELEAKQAVLAKFTEQVKLAIEKAIKPFIDSRQLDLADGVWFAQDFGEKLTTCKLMKSQAKAARTGGTGGGGKKFSVSTSELLDKFGDAEYKEGQTFKAAWEANTDKNWRYAIREALLKKNGNIT